MDEKLLKNFFLKVDSMYVDSLRFLSCFTCPRPSRNASWRVIPVGIGVTAPLTPVPARTTFGVCVSRSLQSLVEKTTFWSGFRREGNKNTN